MEDGDSVVAQNEVLQTRAVLQLLNCTFTVCVCVCVCVCIYFVHYCVCVCKSCEHKAAY